MIKMYEHKLNNMYVAIIKNHKNQRLTFDDEYLNISSKAWYIEKSLTEIRNCKLYTVYWIDLIQSNGIELQGYGEHADLYLFNDGYVIIDTSSFTSANAIVNYLNRKVNLILI